MGKGKHTFNTLLYLALFTWSLISFISGITKILFPEPVPAGAMTTSVGLPITIAVIIIHGILPLIFTIALIFHIVAFFKSDLSAKPFNTEFLINIILVGVAVISILLMWLLSSIEPEIGMLFALPAVLWVITLVVSLVIFFKGFINNKKS